MKMILSQISREILAALRGLFHKSINLTSSNPLPVHKRKNPSSKKPPKLPKWGGFYGLGTVDIGDLTGACVFTSTCFLQRNRSHMHSLTIQIIHSMSNGSRQRLYEAHSQNAPPPPIYQEFSFCLCFYFWLHLPELTWIPYLYIKSFISYSQCVVSTRTRKTLILFKKLKKCKKFDSLTTSLCNQMWRHELEEE